MSEEQSFDNWNEVKKNVETKSKKALFKERDIFFASLGHNIGFEQNGKGNSFMRPVIVLKKFSNDVFLGVPLTSKDKKGIFYYSFYFGDNIKNSAILSQIRLFDTKRLERKIGTINKDDFEKIREAIKKLI